MYIYIYVFAGSVRTVAMPCLHVRLTKQREQRCVYDIAQTRTL